MADAIDYKVLYDQVVAKNEELFHQISVLQNRKSVKLDWKPTGEQLISFVERHYVFCVFMLLLTSAAVSGAYRLWRDRGPA